MRPSPHYAFLSMLLGAALTPEHLIQLIAVTAALIHALAAWRAAKAGKSK